MFSICPVFTAGLLLLLFLLCFSAVLFVFDTSLFADLCMCFFVDSCVRFLVNLCLIFFVKLNCCFFCEFVLVIFCGFVLELSCGFVVALFCVLCFVFLIRPVFTAGLLMLLLLLCLCVVVFVFDTFLFADLCMHLLWIRDYE